MARRVASLHADSQRHGDYEESGELVHTPRLCMSGVSLMSPRFYARPGGSVALVPASR